MQQSTAALAKAGYFRALEIDLAVERHEQLHSFQLRIVRGERSALIDKLVGQVFDGVAQNFKSAPCLGCNATAAP